MRRIFSSKSPVIAARLVLCGASLGLLLQFAPTLVSAQESAPERRAGSAEAASVLGIGESPAARRGSSTAEAPPATPAPGPEANDGTARLSTVRVTRELDVPHAVCVLAPHRSIEIRVQPDLVFLRLPDTRKGPGGARPR